MGNGDIGIFLRGTGNRLAGNAVGERDRGNGGTGIHAEGAGHLIEENTVLGNGGHGIEVTGGVASGPVVVRKNQVGDRDRGNGGHGIVVAGAGNGGGGPVEIDENDVAGNLGDGVRVTGSGHQLRDNASGGAGDLDNGGCEFAVSAGNLDAGGNRVNGIVRRRVRRRFPDRLSRDAITAEVRELLDPLLRSEPPQVASLARIAQFEAGACGWQGLVEALAQHLARGQLRQVLGDVDAAAVEVEDIRRSRASCRRRG